MRVHFTVCAYIYIFLLTQHLKLKMKENLLSYTSFVIFFYFNFDVIEKGKIWIPSTNKVIRKTLTSEDSLKKKKVVWSTYIMFFTVAIFLSEINIRRQITV